MTEIQKQLIAATLEFKAEEEAEALKRFDIAEACNVHNFVTGALLVVAIMGYSVKFDDNGKCTLVAEATDDKAGN